jgi:riboflavin-specific deaminase-like protein
MTGVEVGQRGWPRVIGNFAVTWDGRISTRNRTPSNFSSAADKKRLLEIRALGDAVLAGAATVSADTMSMGLPEEGLRERRRREGRAAVPLRVLVSQSGEVSAGWRVFGSGDEPAVVYSTERMPMAVREALKGKADLRLAEGGGLDLGGVLSELRRRDGVETVVCEGGGRLLRELLRIGAVDELYLTICPWIFGGREGVSLTGEVEGEGRGLGASVEWELLERTVLRESGECFTHWRNLGGGRKKKGQSG